MPDYNEFHSVHECVVKQAFKWYWFIHIWNTCLSIG